MNWKSIILRSSVIIMLEFLLYYLLSGYDFNIGSLLPIFGVFLFCVIFFIINLITDITRFRAAKLPANFTPTLTAIVAGFILIIIIDRQNSPNTSPVIIQGNHNVGVAHSRLILRADNSYEYANYSPLGGTTIKGNYSMHDSIVILDKQAFDRSLISGTLVISTSHPDKRIYQTDQSGQEISGAMFFNVYESNHSQKEKLIAH